MSANLRRIAVGHGLAGGLFALVLSGSPSLCPPPTLATEQPMRETGSVPALQIKIAPGPLQKALSELSVAMNLEILVDPAVISGTKTSGAIGVFTARDGLRAVLVGSGLSFEFLDGAAILRRN